MSSANHSSDWIDISLTIHSGMAHWSDNPAVKIEPSQCLAHGDICNISKLTLGSHTGTHDATIGRARVIAIQDQESIKKEEIEPYNLREGERILFKTNNSQCCYQSDQFVEDFVHISTPAAEYLAEKKIQTIGVDYLSVGGYQKNVVEVHHALLGAGIWVIEGLNLASVAPGEYELVCLPLKIENGDAGLARAILKPLS